MNEIYEIPPLSRKTAKREERPCGDEDHDDGAAFLLISKICHHLCWSPSLNLFSQRCCEYGWCWVPYRLRLSPPFSFRFLILSLTLPVQPLPGTKMAATSTTARRRLLRQVLQQLLLLFVTLVVNTKAEPGALEEGLRLTGR